jgi:flagellar export protein FliJ
MKRFEFTLERVRQWRQTQVDIEMTKLQALFEQMRELRDEAARLAGAVQEAEREMDAGAGAGEVLEPLALVGLDEFRMFARREQAVLARQQNELSGQIAAQRRRLIDARRDHRLLENLRARAFAAWERESDKETEALAGELFLSKWKPPRRQRRAAPCAGRV